MTSQKTPDLRDLTTPIFLALVNYSALVRLGEEVPMDTFRSQIETLLEKAKESARGDIELARDFERILQPLIFFIDYMVKEGPFAFKNEWRLMARDFNELSGDEKFFEILEDVLRYSDKPAALLPFYTMLGIGFDGVYHDNSAVIHNYVTTLAEKLKLTFDHRSQNFTDFPVKRRTAVKKQTFFGKYKALVITGSFAVASLLVNIVCFFVATGNYRQAVTAASSSAMVFSTGGGGALPSVPYDPPAMPEPIAKKINPEDAGIQEEAVSPPPSIPSIPAPPSTPASAPPAERPGAALPSVSFGVGISEETSND